MKVIENRSSVSARGKPGSPKTILDQMQAASRKSPAQEMLLRNLGNYLDNRYVLVEDALPSGFMEPLPAVLAGPTGLWLINTSSISGVYRASGDGWEQMDEKSGVFRPAKSNPVAWTVEQARLLTECLSQRHANIPAVEAVVFFSAADAHVELARPSARIVLIDGVQRFISAVLSAPTVLDREAIQKISETLAPVLLETQTPTEIKDIYTLQEEPVAKPPRTPTRLEEIARSEPQVVNKISRKLPLSRKQWIWIGILIAVNIAILIFLVFIVAVST
jgi:hypothetical protein